MKKTLVFTITILFIFMSLVTSSRNMDQDILSVNNQLGSLSTGKIVFAYCSALGPHGEGPCYFYLDDPLDIIQLSNEVSMSFLTGSAWLPDNRWLCVDYSFGDLYEVDPENGDLTFIGGGGTSLLGLDWDDVNEILYGTSGFALYEIDPEDGSQTYIGSHNTNSTIVSISFDNDGTCYGIGFDTNRNLYTIDIWTGEATFLVPITNCTDAAYSAYDKDTDLLYVRGYDGIYICDIDTGECTILGLIQGEGYPDITALTIPYGIPDAPIISGPQHGKVGIELEYAFYLSDPNNNPMYIRIDWGTGPPGPWLGPFSSDNETVINHTWDQTGNFSIKALAKDIYNSLSDWSDIFNVTIIENEVPNPPIITGPINGKAEFEYPYTFLSTDPNEDKLANYTIEWGDYTTEVVEGPFASGEEIILNHSWIREATYIIRAKAKDIYDAESDWGTLEITIPKSRIYNWWMLWLNRFPLIRLLLEGLLL